MEPTTTAAGALLAKYSVAIASFWGAFSSLAFLRNLTRRQALIAVCTGYAFSRYMTAPVAAWLSPKLGLQVDEGVLCGAAYVLGLVAMNIIPAIKAAAERVSPSQGA